MGCRKQPCGATGACVEFCGNRPGLCRLVFKVWPDEAEVAAVLVTGDDGAVCWLNRRLVHGMLWAVLELWARQRYWTGVRVAVLRARDLRHLAPVWDVAAS